MRARGQRTRGTRGDPAELPRPLAVGYGGITSGDFLSAGQTHRNQNKDFRKKRKTKQGEWAPLTVKVWSSEEQEHADEDINSNISL